MKFQKIKFSKPKLSVTKLKLPNFFKSAKIGSFDFKSLFILSFLSIFTAFSLTIFFISLPFTENYLPQYTYNLKLKDENYKKYTYTVEIKQDESNPDLVNYYLEIAKRRLNILGIEKFSLSIEETDIERVSEDALSDIDLESLIAGKAEDAEIQTGSSDEVVSEEEDTVKMDYYSRIKVECWTTFDSYTIQSALSSTGMAKFYTLKEDVNLEDENNYIAGYLKDSYNPTDINRSYFRRIVVKQSPTTAGGLAYFLVFKPALDKKDEIDTFILENTGKTIGVELQDFMMPYQVNGPDIVVGIGSEEKDKFLYKSIFDTNPINSEITVKEDVAETEQANETTEIENIITADESASIEETSVETENINTEAINTENVDTSSTEIVTPDYPYGFFEFIRINYSKISALFALLTVIFGIILGIINRKSIGKKYSQAIIYVFATTLTLSIWLAYLKISGTEIDLFTIVICSAFILLNNFASSLIKTADGKVIKLVSIVFILFIIPYFAMLIVPEVGYFRSVPQKLVWIVIISELLLEIFKLYSINLANYLSKKS